MKFEINDWVRKDDGTQGVYEIVATRTFEPCCLLEQQGSDPVRNHWAISEELQLLSHESLRSAVGHPATR